MSPDVSDIDDGRRGWRLLAEFAQPFGRQDDGWVNTGLAAALGAIQPPLADVDRFTSSVREAVARAGRRSAQQDAARAQAVVRVMLSSSVDALTAPCGWSFFVIERCARESDSAQMDRSRSQPRPRYIELYLYADCRPANESSCAEHPA